MNETQIKKITRKQISQALLKFEINEGDTLYIRANLGKIGRLDGNFSSTIFGGIMDVLGPNGTLIVPTFTTMSKIWDKDIVTFNEKSPPYTGAFSKRFLRLENVKRSQHPSHSFAAIGKRRPKSGPSEIASPQIISSETASPQINSSETAYRHIVRKRT